MQQLIGRCKEHADGRAILLEARRNCNRRRQALAKELDRALREWQTPPQMPEPPKALERQGKRQAARSRPSFWALLFGRGVKEVTVRLLKGESLVSGGPSVASRSQIQSDTEEIVTRTKIMFAIESDIQGNSVVEGGTFERWFSYVFENSVLELRSRHPAMPNEILWDTGDQAMTDTMEHT